MLCCKDLLPKKILKCHSPIYILCFGTASGELLHTKTEIKGLELHNCAIRTSSRADCDGGIYVGAAGITYAYLHIYNVLNDQERQYFLPLAQKLYERHVKYVEMHTVVKSSKKDVDSVGFLLGKAGFYAVGAVFGKIMGNRELLNQSLTNYIDAASVCKPIEFLQCGSDELFVGRAGYLFGALWLQEKLGHGYPGVPKEDLREIWSTIVQSGRRYARHKSSPCPLMFSYYDTEYLGAAHGLCAILQILLSFPLFLKDDVDAERDIQQTCDFYLSLQSREGNFPCAMDEISERNRRSESNELVHWCHGAPGAIYLFAKAYLHFGNPKYLDACIKCGEVVWTKGLLRKGPGICHGVAGNGYVFLLLHRLTKEPDISGKYLYRAEKFAEFLKDSNFKSKARTPDCPYSFRILPCIRNGYCKCDKIFNSRPYSACQASWPVFVLLYIWGFWLYFAIEANLMQLRLRHSSIQGRILIPPKQDNLADQDQNVGARTDVEGFRANATNSIRHLAEQFTNRPYNSDSTWHICASCEIFVPPRAWHCSICQTCILRRDHHCVFAMQCIGEDNHSNFLGLLFYLAVATFYASCFGYIRLVHIQGVEWYWWLFKCLVAIYTVLIDRTMLHIVMSINFTGCMAATGIFLYYFVLALKGQTSADSSRRISRQIPGAAKYSLKNFRAFLGSKPLLKIVWPFHQITRNQYGYMINDGLEV
ncbi:unnamed protein product [Allacma fusca]|uniref:Palmitoyltransferase n=1 Tax=Allacma fusca TaxID=39272 RepID=A0A8J2KBD4_9HEXA|nr:unnamed protein product [Allacma fusca]